MSSRKPILAEPDRRYWRREANRKVRKARLTRGLLRWSGVLAVNAVIAGMVLYAGARVFHEIITTPEFALAHIDIEGVERASEDRIRQRLEIYRKRNLLDLNLSEVAATSAQDRWVRFASAKRVLPETLRIAITERTPCAVTRIGGIAHVVDTTGHVIGPLGAGLDVELPLLIGPAGLRDDELVAALRKGVGLIERLRRQAGGWVGEVSQIDISRSDLVAVRTADSAPWILLDPTRVERNLYHYLELRQEIQRRVGSVEYVDLRWRDRISVLPKERKLLQEGS